MSEAFSQQSMSDDRRSPFLFGGVHLLSLLCIQC